MAQHDYNVANSDGATVRADLNALAAAAVSLNSGGTAPATTFAHMLWADTTAGLLKMRNAANSAWVTLGTLGSAYLGLVPANGLTYPAADGTAGQVLRTNGSGALSFVRPGMELVASATASNSAAIDFTSISTADYAYYTLVGDNVVPSTNAVGLVVQVFQGGVIQNGAGNYRHHTWRYTPSGSGTGGSSGDFYMVVSSGSETLGTAADQTFSFKLTAHDLAQATQKKRFNWEAQGIFSSGATVAFAGGGMFILNNAACDGLRVACTGGNIASGKFWLYGHARS